MAYDEQLADRVRHALGARTPFAEIAMFGGLCFTVNGNMAVGVMKDDFMVRVGADAHGEAMRRPGAREMDFTKRPMPGFLLVGPAGTGADRDLSGWVDRALAYVGPMPPKVKRSKKKA